MDNDKTVHVCKICKSNDIDAINVKSKTYSKTYFYCNNCNFAWLDEKDYVSEADEKQRYIKHKNSMDDEGYVKMLNDFLEYSLKFVNNSNINTKINAKINTKPKLRALDFGCGHTPVLAELMKKRGISTKIYDPHFYTDGSIVKEINIVKEASISKGCSVQLVSFAANQSHRSATYGWQTLHNNNLSNGAHWPIGDKLNRAAKGVNPKFNLITATEVIEHAKDPHKLFKQLSDLLEEKGILAIMTLFTPKDTPQKESIKKENQKENPTESLKNLFKSWWYITDETHVCFYYVESIKILAEKYRLSVIATDNKRAIILKKI